MRIGLFGGTFNPVHKGHLRAARHVKEGFGLDRIYFIPSAVPPHKKADAVVDATDRLQMLKLAIGNQPDLRISDVEINRPGPSYTVDTVGYFKRTISAQTDLFLIVGLDAFLEIDTWKSNRKLFAMIPMIVLDRPESEPVPASIAERVAQFLEDRIASEYRYTVADGCFEHPRLQPVFIFSGDFHNVSATQIRNDIARGHTRDLPLPEPVKRFIITKGLYR